MHLSILLIAVAIAVLIRLCWVRPSGTWDDRWQCALGAFLLPPILLLMTSMTVLAMGHHGTMFSHSVGWIGCHIAVGFLAIAGLSLAYFCGRQWQAVQQLRSLPSQSIVGRTGRVLETSHLFAAQVGIWNSELVVSRGLLQSLQPAQIEAVLSHEEAHHYYRDPVFFFWFSWIHRLTFWLPQTESLWQELLLLREVRADFWASQQVDALTLAETLLLVVESASTTQNYYCTEFYDTIPTIRLEERINFLLNQPEIKPGSHYFWTWFPAIALPILTVPLHC